MNHHFYTSLPLNDNAGNSLHHILGPIVFKLAQLGNLSIKLGHGVWVNDLGVRMAEPVAVIALQAPQRCGDQVRDILRAYKAQAQQEAVVLAVDGVVAHYALISEEADITKKFGGCTVLSDDTCFAWENPEFL